MSVVIYTRRFCSYCVRAKRLLSDLGVAYKEIAIDQQSDMADEMRRTSGCNTVPQIWVGATHIGGCDELVALQYSGRLVPLLHTAGVACNA